MTEKKIIDQTSKQLMGEEGNNVGRGRGKLLIVSK